MRMDLWHWTTKNIQTITMTKAFIQWNSMPTMTCNWSWNCGWSCTRQDWWSSTCERECSAHSDRNEHTAPPDPTHELRCYVLFMASGFGLAQLKRVLMKKKCPFFTCKSLLELGQHWSCRGNDYNRRCLNAKQFVGLLSEWASERVQESEMNRAMCNDGL